ncbi:hypothetical protein ACPB9J_33190 [Streptomyces lavendulocolor]|uniref:hypothetical protein n=1 Tax=Streptomyces lavendulocolor TaxID=67316 RepID=UPI003C30C07F
MNGPGFPPPTDPMTTDVFRHRWPTGAEKTELIDGVIVFYGAFDERDEDTARRTYPGRRVTLGPGGSIRVDAAPA